MISVQKFGPRSFVKYCRATTETASSITRKWGGNQHHISIILLLAQFEHTSCSFIKHQSRTWLFMRLCMKLWSFLWGCACLCINVFCNSFLLSQQKYLSFPAFFKYFRYWRYNAFVTNHSIKFCLKLIFKNNKQCIIMYNPKELKGPFTQYDFA